VGLAHGQDGGNKDCIRTLEWETFRNIEKEITLRLMLMI
jgi:hypothetical protein